MNIEKPEQIHDMIAVRLFTFHDNGVTRQIHPVAMKWAKRRGIDVNAYGFRRDILLPENMQVYLHWDSLIIASDMLDILHEALDLVRDYGWTSVKSKITKFSTEEMHWLMKYAPVQFSWMTT